MVFLWGTNFIGRGLTLSKIATDTKIIRDELYSQYDWFYKNFLSAVQASTDEFFSDLFSFRLLSVSKNINILFQGDDYFVTKIRIDKQHDMFFRCSSDAIKAILDKILGPAKTFNLANITELEAKIISSFNDYIYNAISLFLIPPPPPSSKRKNFDTIHLTFFIKDKQNQIGGKFIISIPQTLLIPNKLTPTQEKFSISDFKSSKLDVKIKIGTTKFAVKELKNLEKEDIVVFDNSDIHIMKLVLDGYEKTFRINPNPGIINSINNDNGGNKMTDESLSQNLWDNIQVEMGAEFEKVKITLGELKNIEEGLVVDISSVYDNKVSLKVEDKIIAKGELVILNDRYGVRIDETFASDSNQTMEVAQTEPEFHQEEPINTEEAAPSGEEEFDYSDFELDDQDI